ncbi:MAG: M20/M25/M40 family metallo-hydrolase [Clostridia bacterium]|nr:M20/M25/M40 family metallo-hydrolase [Clostridia bacterium]
MKYLINEEYLLDCLKTFIDTPSPVGFYPLINPVLSERAAEIGYTVTFDNRQTAYITLDGEDNSKTVMIGAHADTLGLMVRKVDSNGRLRIRQLGGGYLGSLEGESVTVHTRDGRTYTGLFACQSHSPHVFADHKTLDRDEKTMMILLDEPVRTQGEVYDLGIRPGDYVSVDPRFQRTPGGYIKSRYLDDKAAIACCFTALRWLRENGRRPKYRTVFTFQHMEEVGLGGTFVPAEVSEYVAIDTCMIGPELDGDEYKVSIGAKDASAPYDYNLTNTLIRCAKEAGCEYAVDVFYRYGSDAHAAQRGGNNLAAGLFGMAIYCSHGMERTHITGLRGAANLLLAFLLDR